MLHLLTAIALAFVVVLATIVTTAATLYWAALLARDLRRTYRETRPAYAPHATVATTPRPRGRRWRPMPPGHMPI